MLCQQPVQLTTASILILGILQFVHQAAFPRSVFVFTLLAILKEKHLFRGNGTLLYVKVKVKVLPITGH